MIFCLFNIGSGELLLILFLILIIFGPSKIPEIAKGIGKGIKYINNAAENFKKEIENEINNEEIKSDQLLPKKSDTQNIHKTTNN